MKQLRGLDGGAPEGAGGGKAPVTPRPGGGGEGERALTQARLVACLPRPSRRRPSGFAVSVGPQGGNRRDS